MKKELLLIAFCAASIVQKTETMDGPREAAPEATDKSADNSDARGPVRLEAKSPDNAPTKTTTAAKIAPAATGEAVTTLPSHKGISLADTSESAPDKQSSPQSKSLKDHLITAKNKISELAGKVSEKANTAADSVKKALSKIKLTTSDQEKSDYQSKMKTMQKGMDDTKNNTTSHVNMNMRDDKATQAQPKPAPADEQKTEQPKLTDEQAKQIEENAIHAGRVTLRWGGDDEAYQSNKTATLSRIEAKMRNTNGFSSLPQEKQEEIINNAKTGTADFMDEKHEQYVKSNIMSSVTLPRPEANLTQEQAKIAIHAQLKTNADYNKLPTIERAKLITELMKKYNSLPKPITDASRVSTSAKSGYTEMNIRN